MLEANVPFLYDYPNTVDVNYKLDSNEEKGIIVRLFTACTDSDDLVLFPGCPAEGAQFSGTNRGLLDAIKHGNQWYEKVVASLLRRCKGEPNKPSKPETMETLYQENIKVLVEVGLDSKNRVSISKGALAHNIEKNLIIDLSAIPDCVVRKEW